METESGWAKKQEEKEVGNMAQRRMFSLQVTDTDAFLDMPLSTQALYFHLGMHGDDEGFVGSPRRIARSIGSSTDDLKLLAAKGFIIVFQSGVVVIRDWNINNTLRNDRFHATIYTEEKAMLSIANGNRYELVANVDTIGIPNGTQMDTTGDQHDTQMTPNGCQLGTQMEPELNITKHNITKHNITKPKTNSRDGDFSRFWAVYPKKVGKGDARKVFAKIRGVPVDTMIEAVERQKQSRQWRSNGGQYIPNPATWLNQERWEDDLEVAVKEPSSNPFLDMLDELDKDESVVAYSG